MSLPPDVLLRALKDHALAEALLNAPLVLGSLELFFNPTGLVRSIRRGVANMIDLPMQGLQQGPLQFISGVGQGSASFLKEISGEYFNLFPLLHNGSLPVDSFLIQVHD